MQNEHQAVVPEESYEQELISSDNFQKSISVSNITDTKIFSGDEKLAPPCGHGNHKGEKKACKRHGPDLVSMASRIVKQSDIDEEEGVIRWNDAGDEEAKR
tara:strand:+ start:162 stop:464 length:303 start_codon:yes stop_codon:yes gene_type:complete